MFLSLLDLLRHSGAMLSGAPGPAVSVSENGGHVVVRAALPGIDPKSVQIQLREQWMALSGQNTMEERTEGPDFYRYAASIGHFYREVPLPCKVDPHRAVAAWEPDSQLVVTIPKA